MENPGHLVQLFQKSGVGRRDITDPYLDEKQPSRLGIYDADEEILNHQTIESRCHIPGCIFTASNLLEFENHYNAKHRFSCVTCKKTLPSAHLLDLHIQETHDSFFAVMSTKKPSYACYIESCKEKFIDDKVRFNHCVEVHKLPKDFRFDKCITRKVKKNKKDQSMTSAREAYITADSSQSSTSDETKISENSSPSQLIVDQEMATI